MLRRAKLEFGTLAVGVALAMTTALTLLPATAASATLEKSSLCKAYTAEVKQQSKGSAALGREMAASGKWSSMQKALLGTFDNEASAEKQFANRIGGSAKVKAAVAVALQLDNTFRSIIQHSTSLSQFQSGIQAAESTPKVTAAEKVLATYAKGLCN
jgi:hypothetical protein